VKQRMPDFAGVALVDILANGLAMLIIVIVLSIASRAEHEERTSAQVEDVETMMSRRFSTSLVLNSLAASPPAQLHDYDNSPLDQIRDPHLLPIIELHRNFVREFYTGAVWSREELLREPNAMDAFLASFDEDRKARLRTDIYDVAQYYLAMSILRDHGISVRHWHFLPGGLNVAQAGRCPPGVAAKDCVTDAIDREQSALPALATGPGDSADSANSGGANGENGENGANGGESWPPNGFAGTDGGGAGPLPGPFPGGAALDSVGAGPPGAGPPGAGGTGGGADGQQNAIAGSFPNARPGLGGGLRGRGENAGGSGQPGNPMRFRLSSPDSLREDQTEGPAGQALDPTPEQILAVLLNYLGQLQATLDAGASPSRLLENFDRYIRQALASPPAVKGPLRTLIDFLMLELWVLDDIVEIPGLQVTPLDLEARANTALIVAPNQRLRRVTVGRAGGGDNGAPQLPDTTYPVLRMNAHPDVWRGLTVPLERNAILLVPPDQQRPGQLRWRALAYIAPEFDDFIVGFAYASIDADGQLVIQAEDNRVRLDDRPLHTPYQEALFGARTWLVALYAVLVLGLLGFLLLVRRLAAPRPA